MPLAGEQPAGAHFGPEQAEVVERIARSLGRKYCLNASDLGEFADEAPGLIFERLEHFDATRSLEAWVYVVLKNLLFDELRRKAWQQRKLQLLKDELAQEQLPERSSELDLTSPFSARDLQRLDALSPRPRLVSLCILGLWEKVPPDRQQQWLLEAELSVNPVLDADFRAAELSERFQWLAQHIHSTHQAVRIAYYRGKKWLQKLEFVQGHAEG